MVAYQYPLTLPSPFLDNYPQQPNKQPYSKEGNSKMPLYGIAVFTSYFTRD